MSHLKSRKQLNIAVLVLLAALLLAACGVPSSQTEASSQVSTALPPPCGVDSQLSPTEDEECVIWPSQVSPINVIVRAFVSDQIDAPRIQLVARDPSGGFLGMLNQKDAPLVGSAVGLTIYNGNEYLGVDVENQGTYFQVIVPPSATVEQFVPIVPDQDCLTGAVSGVFYEDELPYRLTEYNTPYEFFLAFTADRSHVRIEERTPDGQVNIREYEGVALPVMGSTDIYAADPEHSFRLKWELTHCGGGTFSLSYAAADPEPPDPIRQYLEQP